ncbi:TlpA family protein disulfide reductase [Pinibacter aurantiacus]|uniref:TlpA family protein disulfide reductase n=1 Tax=Pinibacter aurantiacus TaxID=2851599 RepID=A0A9E2S9D5_9BACT|nr:TlpA disulfide reductase family protein [Pinibacter aurantiacus]MBV4357298.1 TlpA family protein disulfide reductase [Pinibacter aurantiacus]
MREILALLLFSMSFRSFAESKSIVLNNIDTLQNKNELRIGDPAPEVKVRWIKGKPVQKFEKGMVYVFEFWATWCGPCIKAMPHVTELAKKYAGKATFTGVSVWERGKPGQNINELVDKFVKDMDDRMGYNVAMDGIDGYMVKNWVEATGQTSIPATIIVDGNGKIAWIGQPMEMDSVLLQIIEGKFDSKGFAAKIAKSQESTFKGNKELEAQVAALKPIQDAIDSKDYGLAMKRYNSTIQADPSKKSFLFIAYYTSLIHLDPDQAYSDALRFKDSAMIQYAIVRVFSAEENLNKKFYAYAISYFEKQPNNFGFWPMSSAAYFNFGDVAKAVETLQKFIDWCNAAKAPPPAAYLEKEMDRLQRYKNVLEKK